MWWDRSELTDIYVSPTCIGLASQRAGATSWVEADGLEDGLDQLAKALTQPPVQTSKRLRVWLASALARPLMLSAASGARNREEAKSLAMMLAPDATGFDEPVRVWAGAWRKGRGGLAVVMPERAWTALHSTIAQASTAGRALALVSVRPWWNHAMDAVIAKSKQEASRIGWSLAEVGGVLHGVVDRGQPVEAGFDLPASHDVDATLLRRRLEVQWDPRASTNHLDFVRDGGVPGAPLGGWRHPEGVRA